MQNRSPPGAGAIQSGPERREAARTRAVFRIARVQRGEDQGLGRVRNISDGGMKLETGLTIDLNDTLDVELSAGVVLQGQVVWINGSECGVRFDVPVDSAQALTDSAQEARAPHARPARLKTQIPASTHSDRGVRAVRVSDVSLSGMKLDHDGSLTAGLQVKVTLCSGIERRGTVRWVEGRVAGLLLSEPFTVEDLGSIQRLASGG